MRKFIFNLFIKRMDRKKKHKLISRGKWIREFNKYDYDIEVHCLLASAGYYQKHYIFDKYSSIRYAAISNATDDTIQRILKHPDVFIDDDSPKVRVALVNHRLFLSEFLNDANKSVRKAVAYQGYGIKRLLHDPEPSVRRQAKAYITHRILRYINSSNYNDDAMVKIYDNILDMYIRLPDSDPTTIEHIEAGWDRLRNDGSSYIASLQEKELL